MAKKGGVGLHVRTKSLFNQRPEGLHHYAWVIVLVVVGLQALSNAVRFAFGIFVEPLAETFGWDRGSIGLAFALQWVAMAVFAPVAGWLGEVYGVRRTVLVAVVLFTLGMMLTGTITQLWQFYLYYSVMVGAAVSIFSVPLLTSVIYWFKSQRGLAIGIVMGASVIGPAFAAPLILYLVDNIGWTRALLISGLVSGLVMLGLALLFYDRPSDKGLKPYGVGPGEKEETRYSPAQNKARASTFLRRVRTTFNFWNLINIHFLGCVGHSIIIVYVVSIAIQKGIDPVAAAGVVSTFAAVSVITRFLTPVMSDRLSPKIVMAVCYFLQGAPVFILLVSDASWHFYLFAVIFGIGFGGEGSVFPLLNGRYYRDAPVGTAYGWQLSGAGLGMALGGWGGGFFFDLTGTYTMTILISAGASLAGMASIFLLASPDKHLIPDWEHPPSVQPEVAVRNE